MGRRTKFKGGDRNQEIRKKQKVAAKIQLAVPWLQSWRLAIGCEVWRRFKKLLLPRKVCSVFCRMENELCLPVSFQIYRCRSSADSKPEQSWQGILRNEVPKLPVTAGTWGSEKRNKNAECEQTIQHRESSHEQRKGQACGWTEVSVNTVKQL